MKQDIFDNILNHFNGNINSHVFLFNTNDKEKCLEQLKVLITKIINADEVVYNQIMKELYIELFVIRNEGKEIKADQISFLLDKIKTKPILSKYLFYIINDAEHLNTFASNKLLKTIEEPNNGVIGMLITDNIGKILPTIKSRCEIVNINFDKTDVENSEFFNEAIDLIKIIETKELVDVSIYKIKNPNIMDNFLEIIDVIIKIYNSINIKNIEQFKEITTIINDNNSKKEILKKAMYLNKIYPMIESNMNKELLFEKILVDFKGMKE